MVTAYTAAVPNTHPLTRIAVAHVLEAHRTADPIQLAVFPSTFK